MENEVALYSKRTSKKGRVMFFRNGKIFREQNIPEGSAVLDLDLMLDEGNGSDVTVETEPEMPSVEKMCIFGDEVATTSRYLNSEMVPLCEAHYSSLTLGEVAAQVRLMND